VAPLSRMLARLITEERAPQLRRWPPRPLHRIGWEHSSSVPPAALLAADVAISQPFAPW